LISVAQSNSSPERLIFKVKREFASKCKANQINLTSVERLVAEFPTFKYRKLFPQHQTEKSNANVDLSTLYEIKEFNKLSSLQLLKTLQKNPVIEYAELVYPNQLTYTPSDTQNYKQWYLTAIQAFNGWNIETGDTNVVIGIVDTGFDIDHPDLLNDISYNYQDPVNGIDDDQDGYIYN
jgi:subtilisin family serine protease